MAGEQLHPSSSRALVDSARLRQHFRLRAQGRQGCVLTVFVVPLVAIGVTQSFVVVAIGGSYRKTSQHRAISSMVMRSSRAASQQKRVPSTPGLYRTCFFYVQCSPYCATLQI